MKQDLQNKAVLLLKKTELFQAADIDTLAEGINLSAEFRNFKRGEVVFSNEDYKPAIGLMLTGKAKVKKGHAVINTLEPGSLFGAITLFSDKQYYATEITASAACKVLFLPRILVIRFMVGNSAIAESYISYLSKRIYFLTDKIESFTSGSAEIKLANYLLNSKKPSEEGIPAVLVNNFSLLARELDIGRASLYRAVEYFTAEGAIERSGKEIMLKDEKKLAAFGKQVDKF